MGNAARRNSHSPSLSLPTLPDPWLRREIGTDMSDHNLAATAQAMVAPGKGILAADESVATISKRFAALGIESTFESRRAYRDLLLTTPDLSTYVSGAILYD